MQKHPDLDLFIYNYTQKCQFEHLWSPDTKMCRGLITDSAGVVVARPFDKFFNMEEAPDEVPKSEAFKAFDKADGSLGIMYVLKGAYPHASAFALATRGSFISEQAIEGTKILQESLVFPNMFHPEQMTYMFEIIYPENRIVIDYKGERKLIFLGARDIETGRIFTPEWFPDITRYFESVKEIKDYAKPRDNAEGVVLYFDNGFMCKVKYEEYIRLHRLVTGVTARSIWDMLRHNGSLKELLERVPEEFSKWVQGVANGLMEEYKKIAIEAEEKFDAIYISTETRKEFALKVFSMKDSKKYSALMFKMYDKKPMNEMIWMMIKPSAEKPFREDM